MFHVPGFLFALALYFLPTFIACGRGLYSRFGIFLLNLFAGWTFFGWIAALIWAIAAPPPCWYARPPYPPYPPPYR